jgi:hypothetical protein
MLFPGNEQSDSRVGRLRTRKKKNLGNGRAEQTSTLPKNKQEIVSDRVKPVEQRLCESL